MSDLMSAKQLLVRATAREKILRGATALADAVRITLGPRSKCVLVERKWGKPLVCNDGVTIAKEMSLKDPEENMGLQVLREAAERIGEAEETEPDGPLPHAILTERSEHPRYPLTSPRLYHDEGRRRGHPPAPGRWRRRERMQVATVSPTTTPPSDS
jgi:hypothetical protein